MGFAPSAREDEDEVVGWLEYAVWACLYWFGGTGSGKDIDGLSGVWLGEVVGDNEAADPLLAPRFLSLDLLKELAILRRDIGAPEAMAGLQNTGGGAVRNSGQIRASSRV